MNYQESDLAAEEFDQCVRLHTEAHIYNSSFAGRFCDRSSSLVSGLCTTETEFRYRSQKLNLNFSVQLDLTKCTANVLSAEITDECLQTKSKDN